MPLYVGKITWFTVLGMSVFLGARFSYLYPTWGINMNAFRQDIHLFNAIYNYPLLKNQLIALGIKKPSDYGFKYEGDEICSKPKFVFEEIEEDFQYKFDYAVFRETGIGPFRLPENEASYYLPQWKYSKWPIKGDRFLSYPTVEMLEDEEMDPEYDPEEDDDLFDPDEDEIFPWEKDKTYQGILFPDDDELPNDPFRGDTSP